MEDWECLGSAETFIDWIGLVASGAFGCETLRLVCKNRNGQSERAVAQIAHCQGSAIVNGEPTSNSH